ncbi:hypothetical protein BX600DRAFT_435403 [Xylariales sp. PMI_506]|nr:hypothetical protein BX600DRAFT_435403 [Xylariales sp. PMI_506]
MSWPGSEIIELSSDASDDESDEDSYGGDSSTFGQWKRRFTDILDSIETFGTFATSVRVPSFPIPGLKIAGNQINLPLLPRDAEAIKSVCSQAPFGRGAETVVDTTVRNTWELAADQFEYTNPNWTGYLTALADEVAGGLGLRHVRPHVHKLLLYEKGSFFKPHKDSEKAPGMVGTLVICLPSKHEGGEIHVSHGRQNKVMETGPASNFNLQAFGWFSDVKHSIQEITSGYRLVVTYNFIRDSKAANGISAGLFVQQSTRIANSLRTYRAQFPNTKRLIYFLEHKYSSSSLTLANLKGTDAAVCHALEGVCQDFGLFVFLALTTKEEAPDDDYDDGEADTMVLNVVKLLDGTEIASSIDFDEEDILDSNFFRNRAPDSEDEGSFTGNESAPSKFRYHSAAMVIIPKSSLSQLTEHGNQNGHALSSLARKMIQDGTRSQESNVAPPAHITDFLNKVVDGLTAISTNPYAAVTFSESNGATLAEIAAYACDVQNDALYNKVLQRSVPMPQTHRGLLAGISQLLERNFATASPTVAEWMKYLGYFIIPQPNLEALNKAISIIRSSITLPHLWQSFLEREPDMLLWSFQLKSTLKTDDLELALRLIADFSKASDQDRLIKEVLRPLVGKGNRSLLSLVVERVLELGRQGNLDDSTFIAKYILKDCKHVLSASLADPKGDYRMVNPYQPYQQNLHWGQFVKLLAACLQSGLDEEAMNLLQSTGDLIATEKDSSRLSGSVGILYILVAPVVDLLERQSSNLHAHPAARTFVESIIRRVILPRFPVYPPAPRGWAHHPVKCYDSKPGGSGCEVCVELNRFLVSETEKVGRFARNQNQRKHIESVLTTNFYKFETDKSRSPHTLIVTKRGTEYQTAVKQYKTLVEDVEKDVIPLRRDFIQKALGDDAYQELIMLAKVQGSKGSAELAEQAGWNKRKAEGVEDGSNKGSHSKRRA